MEYFIPYRQGGGTVVDWDFTNPIHCFNWFSTGKDGYAVTSTQGKRIKMHRMLLGFPKEVDHINGQRNDNRLKNLRSVSSRQNGQNKSIHRYGHLLGTVYESDRQKWKAQIRIGDKRKFIGRYDTQIEAHIAYVMYARGL